MADCLDDTEDHMLEEEMDFMSGNDPKPAVIAVAAEEDEEDVVNFKATLKRRRKKKRKKKKIVSATDLEAAKTKAEQDPTREYSYTELLDRVYKLLRDKNPNHGVGRARSRMRPPQMVRVGTRKSMWSNYANNCQTMHRQPEHVMSYVLAELGTEGSIDGNTRLVMKGRYTPKQIESLLKKYLREYVVCKMCRLPDTTLARDSRTRMYFLECENCKSRRSVAPIKAGYHATSRSDRRAAKAAVK